MTRPVQASKQRGESDHLPVVCPRKQTGTCRGLERIQLNDQHTPRTQNGEVDNVTIEFYKAFDGRIPVPGERPKYKEKS